jgi:hypothetical protein
MQAELTALRGLFQLAPNRKKAAGTKDDNREGGKKQDEGDSKKQKNKKNNANKKEQKRDENWKKTPSKEGEAHKKKVKGHTWHWCKYHMAWGNHKEELCRLSNERTTSKPAASTKLQPKPPRQPSSTPSGKPSWPTWPATWPMTDWPDSHGNHGQRSG